MATRWVLAWLGLCWAARGEFLPELMQPLGTNVILGRSTIVTSNWFFAGGYVASSNRGLVEQALVYAQPRPAFGKPGQWIAPAGVTQEFGASVAMRDGILAVKDSADTWFFREEGGQWIADGKIEAGEHWSERVGPVMIASSFLISGSEVYRWPSREYIQTLAPTNVQGTVWAVTMADGHLVMSFAPAGVLTFDYDDITGRWTNGVRLEQPEGAVNAAFGATLGNWYGVDLLVGAPLDDEKGTDAGAVYIYRSYAQGGWTRIQKLMPALGMAGDQFGASMTSDSKRLYISAPFRNEEKQQAGAIFIYEMPETRGSFYWEEKERVALRGASDFARLGLATAVQNRMIYASAAGKMLALHPSMKISLLRRGAEIAISLPVWDRTGFLESTADLNSAWEDHPALQQDSMVQATSTTPSRFFRMRLEPAF